MAIEDGQWLGQWVCVNLGVDGKLALRYDGYLMGSWLRYERAFTGM